MNNHPAEMPCCRPGDGYLKCEPVKSNGLSKLMEAASDMSPLTAGQRRDDFSGMTAPKANNPQVSQ